MLEKITKIDESIFLYLNNLGSPNWDSFWLLYTEKITHLPMMLIIAFLLYKTLGLKRFGLALIFIAIMIIATDQLTNIAKYGFQRPRPCRVVELKNLMRYIAKNCGRYGYFSGHSSNSMALAIFIGLHLKKNYKWLFPTLIIWALGMGYSRIYIGVHYPGDLLTGFAVGSLIGYLFYELLNKFTLKYSI